MQMNHAGKIEVSFVAVLLLAGATVVASGIVFLFGIWVGKGMVEARLTQQGRVVRLPASSPGTPAKPEDGLTFWGRLEKGQTPVSGPAEATPRAEETPIRIPPPGAAAAAAKATEAPAPQPTEPPARTAAVPPPIEGGTFQVQVNAMADRTRAEQLLQDLQGLGYRAVLSTAKIGSKTLYRVRVAGLPTADAAKQAVSRLREQGYPRAFVVAEGGR